MAMRLHALLLAAALVGNVHCARDEQLTRNGDDDDFSVLQVEDAIHIAIERHNETLGKSTDDHLALRRKMWTTWYAANRWSLVVVSTFFVLVVLITFVSWATTSSTPTGHCKHKCQSDCGLMRAEFHFTHCCTACEKTNGRLHGIRCAYFRSKEESPKLRHNADVVSAVIVELALAVSEALQRGNVAEARRIVKRELNARLKWSNVDVNMRWATRVTVERSPELRISVQRALQDGAPRFDVADPCAQVVKVALTSVFPFDPAEFTLNYDLCPIDSSEPSDDGKDVQDLDDVTFANIPRIDVDCNAEEKPVPKLDAVNLQEEPRFGMERATRCAA